MPKETKPFSGWPDNKYTKRHLFSHYAWQEASNACAKAVKERDDKMREKLEEIYNILKEWDDSRPIGAEFGTFRKGGGFDRWMKKAKALLNK